jgi:hypothetical protein
MLIFVLVLSLCAIAPLQTVRAAIYPATLTKTLAPGQSITETKNVSVPMGYWDWLMIISEGQAYDYVANLTLIAAKGNESWLTSVSPVSYAVPIFSTDNYTFSINITVPAAESPGVYNISIWSYDNTFMKSYLDQQTVTIDVPSPVAVVPEYPFGTILGVLGCFAALAVFCSPRLKMRPKFKT